MAPTLVIAIYQVEVVNNTDSTIDVKSACFMKSYERGVSIDPLYKALSIGGNTTETMFISWNPRFYTYVDDTLLPPGTPLPPLPSIKEQMENIIRVCFHSIWESL